MRNALHVLVLLLLACACASSLTLPQPLQSAASTDLRRSLEAPSLQSVLADFLPASESLVRIVYMPTAQQALGGVNPCVSLPRRMPVVGEVCSVLFSTRCGGDAPDAECWLVWSMRALASPISFDSFGMPGAWLMVAPDQILSVPLASNAPAGSIVTRTRGDVLFQWTPPPSAAGTRLFCQLVVAAPGQNRAGFLASPAVEIAIGSARP